MAYRKRSRSSVARRRRAPARIRRARSYRKRRQLNRLTRVPNGQAPRILVGLTAGNMFGVIQAPGTRDDILFMTGKSFYGPVPARELQGWDQWKTMYNSYRVMAMKVVYTVTPVTANPNLLISSYVSKDSGFLANSLAEASNKYTKVSAIGGQTTRRTHAHYWKARTPFGMTRQQWHSDPGTEAATAANPSIMSYLHISIRNQAVTAMEYNVTFKVKMYLEMTDPITLVDI